MRNALESSLRIGYSLSPIEQEDKSMKKEIHPAYDEIKVVCSCGHSFSTRSTLGHELRLEICSKCHPFYTGQQKIIDTAGRVERFKRKYGKSSAANANKTEDKTNS